MSREAVIVIVLAIFTIIQAEELFQEAEVQGPDAQLNLEEQPLEREKRELADDSAEPLQRMKRIDLEEELEGLRRKKRSAEGDIEGENTQKAAKKKKRSNPENIDENLAKKKVKALGRKKKSIQENIDEKARTKKVSRRKKRTIENDIGEKEIEEEPAVKAVRTPAKMRITRATGPSEATDKNKKRKRRDIAAANKLSLGKKKAVGIVEDLMQAGESLEEPVLDLAETLGQVRRSKRDARKAIVALEHSERRHHEALMRERRELRHKLELNPQQAIEEAAE